MVAASEKPLSRAGAARLEKFIIEVDGQSHTQTHSHDARRDAWLAEQGYHVLRIAAVDVLERLDDVARTITHALATHIARNA